MTSPTQTNKQGFTLIELSIVLVIIGLIVGGVLVGQDLIKAAQIRATIAQIEKFDAAVNTFHGKYNGLPGDVANCSTFFAAASCPATGGSPPAAMVAGDGVLTDFSGTRVKLTGEVAAFFNHLYVANLIAEPMSNTTGITTAGQPTINTAFPAAKLGAGNFIVAYTGSATLAYPGMAGSSVYRLTGMTAIDADGDPTLTSALTSLEAFAIDAKKDDGTANSGIVQGTDNTANFNSAATPSTDAASTSYAGASSCLASATAYNTVTAANVRVCQLLMRTSF